MTKQQRIEALQKRLEAVTAYAQDLKARHDRSIKLACDIASGLGRKRNETWAASHLAADELEVISKMRLRTTEL